MIALSMEGTYYNLPNLKVKKTTTRIQSRTIYGLSSWSENYDRPGSKLIVKSNLIIRGGGNSQVTMQRTTTAHENRFALTGAYE